MSAATELQDSKWRHCVRVEEQGKGYFGRTMVNVSTPGRANRKEMFKRKNSLNIRPKIHSV